MKTKEKKGIVRTLIDVISGRSAKEIDESVPMDSGQASKGDDKFLADFRTDRFASGGMAMAGRVAYNQIYAQQTTAVTTPMTMINIEATGTAEMEGTPEPWAPPTPAPDKVAKVGVRPKEVLAELGRLPTHWSLEGLDTKIEMLEAKRVLITQHYAAQDVDGLLQCLRNRKKYDERAKDGTTHREFFGRFDATDHTKVLALCAKHGLVLKDADLFIPEMPDEATRAMKAVTDHCMELCGKKPRLYVIANEEQFRDVTAKRDPIVLAQSPFGFYYYILGAWDAEMLYLPDL